MSFKQEHEDGDIGKAVGCLQLESEQTRRATLETCYSLTSRHSCICIRFRLPPSHGGAGGEQKQRGARMRLAEETEPVSEVDLDARACLKEVQCNTVILTSSFQTSNTSMSREIMETTFHTIGDRGGAFAPHPFWIL